MKRALTLLSTALLLVIGGRVGLSLEASGWDRSRAPLALSTHLDDALADGTSVTDLVVMGIAPGDDTFIGEWTFATHSFAAAGHAQIGLAHPELADQQAARAAAALDILMTDEAWAFDAAIWGDVALDHLDRPSQMKHDHAVLGYLGLPLGLLRRLDPDNRHAATHDALVTALSHRMQRGPILATYPGGAWPVDHAMSIATIALHADVTGQPRPAWLQAHLDNYRRRFVDDEGLLIQRVKPGSGSPVSVARGSGTTLAAWALSYADPALARDLATSARDVLGDRQLGLTVVREYSAATCASGHACVGDVDSGPLILGASISGTGFALSNARLLGDEDWLAGLWVPTRTFGGWTGRHFASGGSLGNAIMLAMLTTPALPPDETDPHPISAAAR